jgi:hypothetical protein
MIIYPVPTINDYPAKVFYSAAEQIQWFFDIPQIIEFSEGNPLGLSFIDLCASHGLEVRDFDTYLESVTETVEVDPPSGDRPPAGRDDLVKSWQSIS